MLLFILAYLGGALTILSPCILPVLPFVFSRAGQPFMSSTLPLLLGMALTFAVVATLAAVGGGWVVAANQYGRWAALVLVAFFGLALMLPQLAERLTHPLVNAGNRLTEAAQQGGKPRPGASLLLGVATGLLWAPCAGPILGLVLTGAALQGANLSSTLLLLAYASRCLHISGDCLVLWRQSVCRYEACFGHHRMDTPCAGWRHAGWRCGHCFWRRYRCVGEKYLLPRPGV